MTDFTPTRKLARRRERKGIKATDKAVVAAYNRDGLAGIVEGIGGGEPSDWPQEDGDEA